MSGDDDWQTTGHGFGNGQAKTGSPIGLYQAVTGGIESRHITVLDHMVYILYFRQAGRCLIFPDPFLAEFSGIKLFTIYILYYLLSVTKISMPYRE
jgi:hypothetical protein